MGACKIIWKGCKHTMPDAYRKTKLAQDTPQSQPLLCSIKRQSVFGNYLQVLSYGKEQTACPTVASGRSAAASVMSAGDWSARAVRRIRRVPESIRPALVRSSFLAHAHPIFIFFCLLPMLTVQRASQRVRYYSSLNDIISVSSNLVV